MTASALLALPGVAPLAAEPGVHVVGGAVRDVLLGATPHEVDVVVEGDAVALARRLGDVVAVHERFGTATVQIGGTRLDLASARRERYPAPGALPEVELGASVEEDLRRRDFTINAIAVELIGGRVTSAPGAIEDLRGGLLRVLHPASFQDDPTRLLRLARYAARLGFVAEPGTADLAGAAVAGGALATVTPGRLGSELRLLLREPQPAALLALAEHGLGAALLGERFSVDPAWTRRALELCPPDARPDLVALAGACRGIFHGLPERLSQLGFPAADIAIVKQAAASPEHVMDALEGLGDEDPPDRATADAVLSRKPLEVAVVVAASSGPAAELARGWLAEDRHHGLAITGGDLLAAGMRPGPEVGRALAAARTAMLAGRAPDRDAQLAVALGT